MQPSWAVAAKKAETESPIAARNGRRLLMILSRTNNPGAVEVPLKSHPLPPMDGVSQDTGGQQPRRADRVKPMVDRP